MSNIRVLKSTLLQWRKFIEQCLSERTDVASFRELSKLMIDRHPIPGKRLVDIVLDGRSVTNVPWDPLIPLYVDALHRLGRAKVHDILTSLLEHSSLAETARRSSLQDVPNKDKPVSTLMTDFRIFQDIIMAVTTGHAPKTSNDANKTLATIADWMSALLAWTSNGEGANGQPAYLTHSADIQGIFESIGILFAALAGSEKIVNSLSTQGNKGQRIKLGQALSGYIPLCAEISIPLRSRLDALQKEFELYGHEGGKSLEDTLMEGVNVSTVDFESNIMDGPAIASKAGLYIYLNSLLVGRPLVDDSMFINFLNNRYGGHHMALIEELIAAAFEVLSNGMYRNESNRTMFLFRSFLVNKLPAFLAEISASSMDPIPMELCIGRALSRVDPNAFPSFSEMFSMQGNSVLSDVRQEFLFACALHKLIPEASIERLLGENPMQTLPVGGQYTKENLVSQINNSPERAEQLLNEIDSMEGNAGAIAKAITEVMHSLCSRKDTVTLKSICNSLSRRPQSLDIMLLFISPATILQPLCALLDTWKWDEDQGSESQPVYDEFGSILLLVLAFKYKYDLSPHDLGISNPDSFVLRLLERGSSSQRLEDLSEKQTQNLGAWITALFIAEGISDESMSSCSPQEFYLLVATLFSQSLAACEAGKLEFETLKGGFEYLLEPFLLPSLVMALTWLSNHIWESENDLTTALRILNVLIRPSSISGEAQEIHRTVLFITARSLEEALKHMRSRHPTRQDIKPILDALEPYHSFQRTGAAYHTELESWSIHSGGGIIASIRNIFSSLVLWSQNPDLSMTPPSYTHRQLLAGIRILGSVRVLHGLIEELKITEPGCMDVGIDVAATVICTPLAESFAAEQAAYHPLDSSKGPPPKYPILTLRDALALEQESMGKLIETDTLYAELIVRLRRRVDALTAVPQITQEVSNLDVGKIMQDMDLENEQMGMGGVESGPGGAGGDAQEDTANINEMLNAAAAAAAAGAEGGLGQDMVMGGPGDTSLDDMLNATDMGGVGNPEFLDLDMEGMFG
ncbi:hypothetical protein AJ80_02958 [Polytolypa hystricis UAMH7299]|uniref:Mediator of RNA polymerase II transcription subunit 5 n=1 Tax=Polytolypa hystricis (strain UAMH7299) TaxID=1447883 RepID=A0A2B7YPD5_POLH7|nr:hypothetical protein AJ80_02958 [Polytolypa hystricis UAMH7299]